MAESRAPSATDITVDRMRWWNTPSHIPNIRCYAIRCSKCQRRFRVDTYVVQCRETRSALACCVCKLERRGLQAAEQTEQSRTNRKKSASGGAKKHLVRASHFTETQAQREDDASERFVEEAHSLCAAFRGSCQRYSAQHGGPQNRSTSRERCLRGCRVQGTDGSHLQCLHCPCCCNSDSACRHEDQSVHDRAPRQPACRISAQGISRCAPCSAHYNINHVCKM
jgi:hypothetical protein